MALNTVTTGNTVLASDVNQLVNVLQRASGQTEAGKYFIDEACYANTSIISQYMTSLSRVSTPVSVSIDTSDVSPSNCGSPSTAHLTANGFQVDTASNTINVNCGCGGNATIQF